MTQACRPANAPKLNPIDFDAMLHATDTWAHPEQDISAKLGGFQAMKMTRKTRSEISEGQQQARMVKDWNSNWRWLDEI